MIQPDVAVSISFLAFIFIFLVVMLIVSLIGLAITIYLERRKIKKICNTPINSERLITPTFKSLICSKCAGLSWCTKNDFEHCTGFHNYPFTLSDVEKVNQKLIEKGKASKD